MTDYQKIIALFDIAVLIPCYNEAATIGQVVKDFQTYIPGAAIYVYDNNSNDNTIALAQESGAIVCQEPWQGKGNVVRRMFADIEADIYVLVDGDDTYAADAAPILIETLINSQVDMVTGARAANENFAYRFGHRFGNRLFSWVASRIFGHTISDLLSGYRVLSRRFVKAFPGAAQGFEIELELTVHALSLRIPNTELVTQYRERPENSFSKLHTIRDGCHIFLEMIKLFKNERPLTFFLGFSLFFTVIAFILMVPVFFTYIETGLVPRFPTAILSAALIIMAFLSLTAGIILDTVSQGRREIKRLQYLSMPCLDLKDRLKNVRDKASSTKADAKQESPVA